MYYKSALIIFLFQIVAFGAMLAAAHGYGHAVSSQSIVRHDGGHIPLGYAAPYAAPYAVPYATHYAAPLPYAAPIAYAGHYGGYEDGHYDELADNHYDGHDEHVSITYYITHKYVFKCTSQ